MYLRDLLLLLLPLSIFITTFTLTSANPVVSLRSLPGNGGSVCKTSTTCVNDLINGKCGKAVVIFAKGTDQPDNLGDTPGPQLMKALVSQIGSSKISRQGVDYTADKLDNLSGGDAAGQQYIRDLVELAVNTCPSSTKIFLSGYSQGAVICGNAVKKMPESHWKRISGVVLFGAPGYFIIDGWAFPKVPAKNVKVICHSNDLICGHGSLSGHEGYASSKDISAAVDFIDARVS